MIRAIIIEDERHCTNRLLKLLAHHSGFITVVGCFDTIDLAKQAIEQLQPDLVFLDILLRDSTAFDLLKVINKINFKIIFTTAYDKYAIKAIKFSAFDYLLKPIDHEELSETILRLKPEISISDSSEKIKVLIQNTVNSGLKKLTIVTEKETFYLPIEEIVHCKADGSYTHFFLANKKRVVASKTLKYFNELLEDLSFFRVHQSHLINLKHIVKYEKGNSAFIVMKNGNSIPIAKRRREEFQKIILHVR